MIGQSGELLAFRMERIAVRATTPYHQTLDCGSKRDAPYSPVVLTARRVIGDSPRRDALSAMD
jgi:hypothetical protein